MNKESPNIPTRLQEIMENFKYCEGREKIELLIEYSENMPALPSYLQAHHDRMDFVSECMTPVYVAAEVINGGLHFFFDVPPESPTVRGFAALLSEGLTGSKPQEILRIPNDFFYEMGLEQVLTMQRLNGITAIMAHIKRLATQSLDQVLD